MKVGKYKVRFQYSICEKELHQGKIEQKCTTAILDEFTGSTEEPYREVARATITKYHKDIFSKPLARRLAFTKLIAGFKKDVRAVFWEAYRKEIKFN